MPRLFILIALVFAFIITICATVKTYACNLPPVAEITSDANDVHVGETTNFDGSDSYDPDGGAIQEYYWVFPDEAYYLSGETTAYPKCKFSPNGDYTVKLKVKDNKEVWSDYYEYEITVLAADPDWYVAKDGDDDEDGQSWQTAFATIQIGIESAVVGDRVWVAQGTYSERINLNGKDITVQSTDPNDWDVAEATIIEADGIGTAVTFTGEESADCLLRGFTITDGGLPDPETGRSQRYDGRGFLRQRF